MNTTTLNSKAIDAAARYLVKRDFEVIEKSWSCEAGTIDIIAKDENSLVLCEVISRLDSGEGFPKEEVNDSKRKQLEKIALSYLANYDLDEVTVRFDVIAVVVVGENRALIRHHINAFSDADAA
jgi:putative endonuclease